MRRNKKLWAFFEGAASAFDVGLRPSLAVRDFPNFRTPHDDAKALRDDWTRVSKDLLRAATPEPAEK
jgi:hypothetical protein